jgi:hypothetical protein
MQEHCAPTRLLFLPRAQFGDIPLKSDINSANNARDCPFDFANAPEFGAA